MNTRDVVTCEDAQKAVETYFYSFQAIPPSNKACLWAVLQQFQDHWYPQFKSNEQEGDPIYKSPIPFLNFNSSLESPSSLDFSTRTEHQIPACLLAERRLLRPRTLDHPVPNDLTRSKKTASKWLNVLGSCGFVVQYPDKA
jgi:hypothetical protein